LPAAFSRAPYVIKDFEPGVRAFCTRNPNYFKSDRAWFDEIEILGINDVNARTNALKTGQIDVMNRCDLKTVHLFKRMPGIQVMRQDGSKHFTFAMRTDTAPYDNNDVRLALKYAVDREQLLKTILRGYGRVGNDHPISVANRYHADELPQRQYDPDKARFHLKKAGLSSTTFKFHAAEAAFKGAVDAGVLYREQAAKAGYHHRCGARTQRRLLEQCVDEKALVRGLLGGPFHRGHDVLHGLCQGVAWNDTYWDTSASTNCWWRPVPSWTRRSAAACTWKCSASCATRAAPWCPCSVPTWRRPATRSARQAGGQLGTGWLQGTGTLVV
jgi:peptide/nickel transport system substrate-binding protein